MALGTFILQVWVTNDKQNSAQNREIEEFLTQKILREIMGNLGTVIPDIKFIEHK